MHKKKQILLSVRCPKMLFWSILDTNLIKMSENVDKSRFFFKMSSHCLNCQFFNVIKSFLYRLERELVQFRIDDPHCIEQMRTVLSRKETNYLRMRRAKLHRDDFKKIKTIGIGAFGVVSLVRSVVNGSKSGGLFAMKSLKKSDVIERKQVAHVLAEKDILAEAENEWIVKLFYSFQVSLKTLLSLY
jgi:serine/threonine-protein kinase LATS1/2